jgi:hypothetical protein
MRPKACSKQASRLVGGGSGSGQRGSGAHLTRPIDPKVLLQHIALAARSVGEAD